MATSAGESAKAPQGIDLYSRFALAGALGCSVTHGAFTPVDVYVTVSSRPLQHEPYGSPAPAPSALKTITH